jgi:hypothetical protein
MVAALSVGCKKPVKDTAAKKPETNAEALERISRMGKDETGKNQTPLDASDCIEICQQEYTVADSKCLGNCADAIKACQGNGAGDTRSCVVELVRVYAEDAADDNDEAAIDLVRNGYLDIDKSVTVGNAMGAHVDFGDVQWRQYIDGSERQVVECTGYFDDNSGKAVFTFFINYDGTFNLNEITLVDADGNASGIKPTDPGFMTYLQQIYTNQ